MDFEWHEGKAIQNIAKHGVAFTEAATVFYDPLSLTFADPDHSADEDRFITIGLSDQGRLLIMAHTERDETLRIISARTTTAKESCMSQEADAHIDDELRPEYDETQLKNGIRGKYVARLACGSNIVRLAPDVALAFPTEESVNQALRLLMETAKRTVERTK